MGWLNKMNSNTEENEILVLPKKNIQYRIVKKYVDDIPDFDYKHASKSAHEKFKDWKFGVRIHWGLYSLWRLPHESWPFIYMSNKKRMEYLSLSDEFNPINFDANKWMEFFKRSGIKCFAITTKHHDGFSLFDTKTRVKKHIDWTAPKKPQILDCDKSFSVMESPFKRDIIKELCDAGHHHDMVIDLYYSHPDWFDADFRPWAFHPAHVKGYAKWRKNPWDKYFVGVIGMYLFGTRNFGQGGKFKYNSHKFPPQSKEERERTLLRHREQIRELLVNYGKVDMMCLDQWMGPEAWPMLKETIKMARKVQPDVMFRGRGIGNYGDYHTPEKYVPGGSENTDMPWMVIYPLGKTFSYEDKEKEHKGTKWIIHNLIDSCAKGGNFMVGIGPDETGWFHPTAIQQLVDTGKWLQINAEGIYKTRAQETWKDGKKIRFVYSKDRKYAYLHYLGKPKVQISTKKICPIPKSEIVLLYGER